MFLLSVLSANVFLANAACGFFVEYFALKKVGAVTFVLCGRRENDVRLFRDFSNRRIGFDCLDLGRLNDSEILHRITSMYLKRGVLLDLGCPHALDLLKTANERELFASSNSLTHWLVLTRTYVSKETLETLSEIQEPEKSDPIKFLTETYGGSKDEKDLLEVNRKVNWEFIKTYRKPEKPIKTIKRIVPNLTELEEVIKLNILLDNKITLAVPRTVRPGSVYDLYEVYKKTAESRTKISGIGTVEKGGRLIQRGVEKRKLNFEGAVFKFGSAAFQPDVFTTMCDLTTRDGDIWPKVSYPHILHLAEDLNFRPVIRFFSSYGWPKNGTFSDLSMLGLLKRKGADFSATVILIRPERLDVVDYLQCPFRLEMGILFKEPPLSSVSNVFLLPFSKAIWLSIGGAVLLTAVALRCRVAAGKVLIPPDENVSDFFDVANYVVGAVCQQGFPSSPKSPSARATLLIGLLTSLALFTSYSACIVALMQSSSTAISTIEDITRSNFEVGIQKRNPFYKVLMKEATYPPLKEFYERKVLSRGEKAFCNRREGIERMRTGLFAFEVELNAGYKLISETYQEREKCGIREIDPTPHPLVCIVARKPSPFRETFTQRFAWQDEVGLFDRTWKRWTDQKPNCEVGRIGFLSIGLTEFGPVIRVFAYGIAAATFVLFLELLHKNKKATHFLKTILRKLPPVPFLKISPQPPLISRTCKMRKT